MPKQIFKIDQFHGGLNNNADPRDVNVNEFPTSVNAMYDYPGRIRLMGKTQIGEAANSSFTMAEFPELGTSFIKAHGLFTFSHDRKNAHIVDGSDDALSDGDDYIA